MITNTCEKLLDEVLIPIAEAVKELPVRNVSRACLERWMRQGVNGTVLESVRIANRRYTSKEALRRFIIRSQTPQPQAAPAFSAMSKKELAEKSKKFGLPEPE
jgi:hypothetical protein